MPGEYTYIGAGNKRELVKFTMKPFAIAEEIILIVTIEMIPELTRFGIIFICGVSLELSRELERPERT